MPDDTQTTLTILPADLRLLVGRVEASQICATSPRTWDRLVSSGKTPKALRLGCRPVWRRADLARWVELGCPDRKTFEALNDAGP